MVSSLLVKTVKNQVNTTVTFELKTYLTPSHFLKQCSEKLIWKLILCTETHKLEAKSKGQDRRMQPDNRLHEVEPRKGYKHKAIFWNVCYKKPAGVCSPALLKKIHFVLHENVFCCVIIFYVKCFINSYPTLYRLLSYLWLVWENA